MLSTDNKFGEIASSLAYYLKLFSSLKRFLEYIFLASKYLFQQEFSLLIPLDENGDIWLDNIFCSSDLQNKKIESDVIEFLSKSCLINKFKIKDISLLDQYLNDRFSNLLVNSSRN